MLTKTTNMKYEKINNSINKVNMGEIIQNFCSC